MQNPALEQIILDAISRAITTKDALGVLARAYSSAQGVPLPTLTDLRGAYDAMIARGDITQSDTLDALLRRRTVRTQSGVAIITVLTKPYPCPGQCTYCPSEVRMPKSYIETEPAAQRALAHHFDPYAQVVTRLTTLRANGHPIDKIELIVKGGTWSAYRWDYQAWFIRRCFDACNEFGTATTNDDPNGVMKKHESGTFDFVDLPDMRDHATIVNFTREELFRLEHAQSKNETASQRIIGMTLETRPDWVRPETLWQLRTLGCTRVELGLQHTDNEILTLTKRGHTIEDTMHAMRLLRHAGFKVDVHTMPQQPGSTPEKDFEMYRMLYADERLRPDMIKIYPCVVTPTAEIAAWHHDGRYVPYPQQDLIDLLVRVKAELVPRYCRISRLIRDIPGNEILAGNTVTNLREYIQKIMRERGLTCACLRCREIGHIMKLDPSAGSAIGNARIFIDQYRASDGTEFFLSIEDPERRAVFAFARLYIPDDARDSTVSRIHELLPETAHTAFVRELHTYGFLVPIAQTGGSDQQHRGLGKQLMQEAERIARDRGALTMTVISGVGVRGYYEKIGYRRRGTYMVKSLV